MKPSEIEEMNNLKVKCLKKDGKPKKRVNQNELSRLSELQSQYDKETKDEFPDDTKIGHATKEIVINLDGRKMFLKTVPADFQNKNK